MSSRPTRRPGELTFAIVLVAFGLATLFEAYRISGFTGLSTPGVFPMLAAATMVVSAAVVLLRTARQPPPDRRAAPVAVRFFREVMPLRHTIVVGMILLYLIALPYLGFVISSGLFLLASFQFLWRKNPAISLGLTVVTLIAVYALFRIVFQVVLPQGTWVRGLF